MNNINKKGFTLVELIVVIAIIGILSAVLIPSISSYISKAKDSAALQEAETLKTTYNIWLSEKDDLTEAEGKFDFLVYLEVNKIISKGRYLSPNIDNAPGNLDDYLNGFHYEASNGRFVTGAYVQGVFQLSVSENEPQLAEFVIADYIDN